MNPESPFRSGYVSIIGRSNVGKSTLLNEILGEKVAIVTPKPQTTRNKIVGVKNTKDTQIVFIDTPGMHRTKERLGEFMFKEAKNSIKDVDIVLMVVEPHMPKNGELEIINLLENVTGKKKFPKTSLKDRKQKQEIKRDVFLLLNKIDTIKKENLLPIIEKYASLFPFTEVIPISALKGDGLNILMNKIADYLPEGPKYYQDDIYTDQFERFIVAEIIREKTMNLTKEEIPYSVAVEVVGWQEKERVVVITANIYVEKPTQKGIIIGKKGAMLKSIGSFSRKEIENLLNAKVYLDLWVKVKEGWRNKNSALKELGYQ